jgi:hypothetical protein
VRCLLDGQDYVQITQFAEVLEDGFQPSSSKGLVERLERWQP